MSYGSQSSSRGSRRGGGRGRGTLHHEKSKRKGQKHRSGGKYLLETSEAPAFTEVVEKTLGRLSNLGSQTFAFSPFSQYYDDWLLSLKSVLSEFESNPAVNPDEEFVKERSQVITDIELKLSARRQEEAMLEETARRLADQNNLLVQTDIEYTHENQKLSAQKNSEIKSLTRKVQDLEAELEETNQMKVSIFSPFARKAKSNKISEITQKLDAAKNDLETAAKAFDVEQEKLQDDYEKKKQAIIRQVRSLEKKVEDVETDDSAEDRRFACEEIINTVKALLQRKSQRQ